MSVQMCDPGSDVFQLGGQLLDFTGQPVPHPHLSDADKGPRRAQECCKPNPLKVRFSLDHWHSVQPSVNEQAVKHLRWLHGQGGHKVSQWVQRQQHLPV